MDAAVSSRLGAYLTRRYALLAVGVLILAAFNLTYRLGQQSVGEWDEALYATSAWEMLHSGDLVATTFDGSLDYYNSKPPLQVWILAAMFKAFGVGLVSLRIVSATFAWLTVLALLLWTKRAFGPVASLGSGLVLASTFAFVHLHAGRSGDPDALLALLVLLTVIVLWGAQRRPWQRAWLGPMLAGVFLLKGVAVLLPLALVIGVDVATRWTHWRWQPAAVAGLLFAAPAGTWIAARWRLDGWQFFDRMVNNDLVALSLTTLEGRAGGVFYYLDILQKHQYDWLVVASVSAVLLRHRWSTAARAAATALRARQHTAVLIALWAAATLVVPTVMQTKLPWYLNSFYPLFAVGVGFVMARVVADAEARRLAMPVTVVGLLATLALGTAEGRSLWHLHVVRNLDTSAQGLLLSKAHDYRGRRVCRDRVQRAEAFVVRAMLGGTFHVLDETDGATNRYSRYPGELFLLSADRQNPDLRLVGQADGQFLYEGSGHPTPAYEVTGAAVKP